ncbi:hypothetical protein L2K20_26980 [Mycobacterium sp. MBM]|nr:hypothetical protein [Mycobacterium sp. MBM]
MTNARVCDRFQVLLDFDGLLIDMEPFAFELGTSGRDRWSRFLAHTAEAAPIVEGVELVAALRRIRWRYSISTTRPAAVRAVQPTPPKTFVDHRPSIRSWTRTHLPLQPTNIFLRRGAGAAEACKTEHFFTTATALPKRQMAALFVDDEPAVVDALAEELPALHISDLAGLSDADLTARLHYSAAAAEPLHRNHAEQVAALR